MDWKVSCERTTSDETHHIHFSGEIGVCCRCGKAFITEAVIDQDCGIHALMRTAQEIRDNPKIIER